MSRNDPVVPDTAYLDALFTAIHAFSREVAAAKRWLSHAERAKTAAWRRCFLREARAALDRAPAPLAATADRLAALGPPDTLPAPLDRVRDNLVAMRADLAAQRERLEAAEAKAEPLGQA